jgi:nicotinamide-nucleotide amidase
VSAAHVVGDDRDKIADMVRESVGTSHVVIVSGGLGPTHDDITREGVADGLDLPLEFHEDEWKTVESFFAGFGQKADDSNRRQAYFPEGATPIANRRGTAAGFVIEHAGSLIAVLPGPPRELIPMMEGGVLARVQALFGRPPLFRKTLRTTGIGESTMTPLVQPVFARFPEFDISSLPHIGGVDIVATQRAGDIAEETMREKASEFERELRSALGDKIYGGDDDTLEAVLGAELIKRGETLGIAESLTGGMIGKQITNTPGSSHYLLADVVAYSNESKVAFLGVTGGALEAHGAVSEAVCREMAAGIRRKTSATYGLATTGIAGPGGGSEEKPVGLTYYGLSWEDGEDIRHRVFPGNREDVRSRVMYASLGLLYKHLMRTSRDTP